MDYLKNSSNNKFTTPDQDIIDLIDNINSEINTGEQNISHYITKFFGSYLHTKIGNVITTNEDH